MCGEIERKKEAVMDIWQWIVDFVLCWIKLVLLWLSVPLSLTLMHRYCGAPYVLEREERKKAKKNEKSKCKRHAG